MTEENYNYRTSQTLLRNQFPGKGKLQIPIIPRFQEKPGDFDDLLLIGFDKTHLEDQPTLTAWCISSSMTTALSGYGRILTAILKSCYEMTFFNRKSQRTFTCQIVQNAKRHLKGAKTMQISGIGHSVIRGLGTTGQWFSASTTVYPRGSPQGRRHSYFVDC